MKLSIVVAQSENRVIGRQNKLPWHLPEDLKYFKAVTMGKPIVMGRKTFESIGRPLPGRANIVITRDVSYDRPGIHVVHSLEEAIDQAESICIIEGGDEVMVIGGAEIYNQALSLADRLYLTQVHAEVEGDAFFPEVDKNVWKLQATETYKASGCNPFDYSFNVLDKVLQQ